MVMVIQRYRNIHVGRRIGNFFMRWASRLTYAATLICIGIAIGKWWPL